jgi:hypothetical protein
MSTVVHVECRCRGCGREWLVTSDVATVGHTARVVAILLDRIWCSTCALPDPFVSMLRFTRLPDTADGAAGEGAQAGAAPVVSNVAEVPTRSWAAAAVARRSGLAQ